MAPLFAYCDESGNTGANLGDGDQPVLVVGGWLFPSRISKDVGELVQEFRERTQPHRSEFHGVDLLKTPKGTSLVVDLIYNLTRIPSLPICVVAEKRYVAATKIIDLYLDPESNPTVPDQFDFDFNAKGEVADILYPLSDDTISLAARAYQTLDRQTLINALRSVELGLSIRGHVKLADSVGKSMSHVNNIIAENTASRRMLPRGVMATPNLSAFASWFSFFEQLGRMSEIDSVDIVFDDSAQYSEAFTKLFYSMRDPKENFVQRFPNGNELYGGFQILREFRTASSEEEPLIQAADVLVSALCRYAVDNCLGRQPDSAIVEAIGMTMPVIDGSRRLHKLVGSPKFEEDFLRPFS